MPNWVHNNVEVGDVRILKECVSKNEDDKGFYFDFNKIAPMPKELENSSAPNSNEQLAKKMIKKYGSPDWYHWRLDNWGTKWLPSNTEIIWDCNAEFDTAWSTPEPIFQKLSEKYHTFVYVEYADEDLGYNCGSLRYVNGELVEHTEGDFNFACNVWGLDPEEEKELRGE